jgi:hypothetical protein
MNKMAEETAIGRGGRRAMLSGAVKRVGKAEEFGPSALCPSSTSRCFACRFTEQMARHVNNYEPPSFFCMRLVIRLDEDFDGFLAGVNFDAHRRIAKIHLVSTAILPTDDQREPSRCPQHRLQTTAACGRLRGEPKHNVGILARSASAAATCRPAWP